MVGWKTTFLLGFGNFWRLWEVLETEDFQPAMLDFTKGVEFQFIFNQIGVF